MGDSHERRGEEIRSLRAGIDFGLTIIDTAEMYGKGKAEELVGEAIRGRREEVFLISKVLPANADRKGVKLACEGSLRRLGTEVIDLYMLHWQGAYPLEETVAGMEALQREGKIQSWGVSNLDVEDMERLFALPGGSACAANQILYNLSRRGVEFDLLPWCRERGVDVYAYAPLEQGRILSNKTLSLVADRHAATPAQIALAWLLGKPGVTPIPKAGSEEHARENAASRDIRLDKEDVIMLENTFPAPNRKKTLEML
jgi:diketogulonate reductase-like aldo/keto reductase